MIYDVDKLFANPKALIRIHFPTTGTIDTLNNPINVNRTIYGIVETDFNLDVQAVYSPVDPGSTSSAQQGYNMIGGAVGAANRVIRSIQQTLERWDGHSSPDFTVPIIVVKYKPSIDILDIVRTLTSAPAGTWNNFSLLAPYGYGFAGLASTASAIIHDPVNGIAKNIGSLVYGTWTLRIGNYFAANNLTIRHVASTISKECVKGTNEPLYARMNVTFRTAYLPDARTISGWFLPQDTTDNGVIDTTNYTPFREDGDAPPPPTPSPDSPYPLGGDPYTDPYQGG